VISDFTFITSAEKSDVGLCRKNNEDSIISLPEFGVYCVADGMGGVQDGEVASQAVVDTIEESFVTGSHAVHAVTAKASAKIVALALNKASKWVENRSQEYGVQGCGSTAIAMVFDKIMPGKAIVLHAGDSRAYCFRNKKLIQLSTDHSVAAEAGIKNEDDLPPMLRGVITRAIGLQPVVDVELTPVDVKAGDIFFLCSDGLSRMLSDKKISTIIKKKIKSDNQEIVDALIDNALIEGGKDNVSVVLMRIADNLRDGPLMAIPEETLKLEAMALPRAGDSVIPHLKCFNTA
jgi:serine/threonine protein phosphatase PrpC